MSKASTIAAAISARLATITVANGYSTDIGLTVFRGRRKLDESHIPCAVLVEGDDRIDAAKRDEVKTVQQYFIEGHAECDPDNPNDTAHLILADIKRAVFGGDTTFGNTVRNLNYAGRSIQPREDGLAIVSASIEIGAEFVEQLSNP